MLEILSQGWYILLGVLLLGIVVAVHEFGHFMAARLTGIEVMEFAIGMGPKMFGWTGKKGTKFSVRWIPFGGYCAFYGEDDVDGKAKDDPRAYNKQAVWKRMLTVLMGPAMNLVLAFVAAVIFCWASGLMTGYPVIGSVEENGPAQQAGILPGDVVIQVNGLDTGVLVEDMATADVTNRLTVFQDTISAAEPGATIVFTVQRMAGTEEEPRMETRDVPVDTFWDEELQRARVGISYGIGIASEERTHMGFFRGIGHAFNMCVDSGTAVVDALGKILTDKTARENVSGPIGVVDQTRQMVAMGGAPVFINLLVFISINLGLMNLLPIPGLDGARFLFHTVEAIRRKPVKPELEGAINLAGLALLMGLLVLITFRDVGRLF